MARICMVVRRLNKNVFSGGLLCDMHFARGLVEAGHEVQIVPLMPSQHPIWVGEGIGELRADRPGPIARRTLLALPRIAWRFLSFAIKKDKRAFLEKMQAPADDLLLGLSAALPKEYQFGVMMRRAQRNLPDADLTISTCHETAWAVAMHGKGKRLNLSFHYEPIWHQGPANSYSYFMAKYSYELERMHVATSSSWLKGMVEQHHPTIHPEPCFLAIEVDRFLGPEPAKADPAARAVTVISYGGSKYDWKGFPEMAQAMARVRSALPDWTIRWQVYGPALLPPDNDISPYEALGFLQPDVLAQAYRKADILLSASWYESFPLFPLEAMASGLATISTAPGTEDYTRHGVNCEVVEPKNIESIAGALERLIVDTEYRHRIAVQGRIDAQKESWQRSRAMLNDMVERILSADNTKGE